MEDGKQNNIQVGTGGVNAAIEKDLNDVEQELGELTTETRANEFTIMNSLSDAAPAYEEANAVPAPDLEEDMSELHNQLTTLTRAMNSLSDAAPAYEEANAVPAPDLEEDMPEHHNQLTTLAKKNKKKKKKKKNNPVATTSEDPYEKYFGKNCLLTKEIEKENLNAYQF